MHERHDIPKLEARIGEIRKGLINLGDVKEFDEMLRIIRRPGWTTPAEFLFAMGIVDSIAVQTKSLAALKQSLIAGSREVSIKEGTPA